MEKKKIVLQPKEGSAFILQNDSIVVTPYVLFGDRTIMIQDYLSYIFNDEDSDISLRYLVAERSLNLNIVDVCTNIDLDSIDHELIFISGLWEHVRERVVDYKGIKEDLKVAIELKQFEKQLEKSLGSVIQNISDQLTVALSKVAEMNGDDLKETANEFMKRLEDLNKKVPGILDEPAKKKTKKVQQ